MVYITIHRHLERDNPLTEIKVYSNCNKVESKVNGKARGEILKENSCIYRLPRYRLSEGENIVEVIGISENQKVIDTCKWTYNVK